MKKFSCTIAFLGLCVSLFAQQEAPLRHLPTGLLGIDREALVVHGKVKKVTERTYGTEDCSGEPEIIGGFEKTFAEDGKLLEEITYNGSFMYRKTYQYEGHLVKSIAIEEKENDLANTEWKKDRNIEYTYTKKGKGFVVTDGRGPGPMNDREQWVSYDDNNRLTEMKDGKMHFIYQYDKNGLPKTLTQKMDGKSTVYEFHYDKFFNYIDCRPKSVKAEDIYKLNDKGLLEVIYELDDDRVPSKSVKKAFQAYDEKGNVLKHSSCLLGVCMFYYCRTVEYY